MIDIIKTRFALLKSEFGLLKYSFKWGKYIIGLLKDLSKD